VAQYRHIIWDWNGTLLDDLTVCVNIINSLLVQHQLPTVSSEQYLNVFGFPVRDYYVRVGFENSDTVIKQVSDLFIAQYDHQQHTCDLHAKVIDTLKAVQQLEIPQSILSAYQQTRLNNIVDHFQLRLYFEEVVGIDDIYAHGKIEQGKRLITKLALRGNDVLFVGDTVHDYEVAQEMGTDCVLIANGHQPKQKLETCDVQVLDRVEDVLTLLNK
jgi:phosphoglycolate phosphatase